MSNNENPFDIFEEDADDNRHNRANWKKRGTELAQKGAFSLDQTESLNKMIDSPDDASYTVAREAIKVNMQQKLVDGLNAGQTAAFNEMIEFSNDPKYDAFILKGYAGTGKTFLVKRFIEYITQTNPKHKVAITAPTNKAVSVLYVSSAGGAGKDAKPTMFEDTFDSKSRLVYSTIHKLLGLREVINSKGEQSFEPDNKNESNLSRYKYLIIDEVSMLEDKLCKDVLEYKDLVRIIFMGDPAQIPPVKRKDCIPFRDDHGYKFKTVELTEIMRQKGEHAVVDMSFVIRNNLEVEQPIELLATKLNDKNHGVIYMNSLTEKPKVKPLLTELFNTNEFKDDADHAKVIAWTNNTVNYMNGVVREILYGANADPYVIGEKLIARKPVFKKTTANKKKWAVDYYNIIFNTSEEMEVEGVELKMLDMRESQYRLNLSAYKLNVSSYDPVSGDYKYEIVTVAHPDSIGKYKALLELIKTDAKRDPSRWRNYYNVMKWIADITYNYAITAHKSQGSTYKNVLLIEDDLDLNPRIVERNRIKYTSYSRASERLYVLRENQKS